MVAFGIVGAGNLLFFIGTAPFFLNQVHHHWVVPAFSGLLLAEVLILTGTKKPWKRDALLSVMAWIVLTGAVLFWRQASMLECYGHCGRLLGLGLLFLAAACACAWRTIFPHNP